MSARTNYTFQFLTRLSALAPILLAACAGETDAPGAVPSTPDNTNIVAPSSPAAPSAQTPAAAPTAGAAAPSGAAQPIAPVDPTTPAPGIDPNVKQPVPPAPPEFKGLMQTGAPNHPLAGFPTGAAQAAKLCELVKAENRDDAVANAFCPADKAPKITSVVELQTALGLGFQVNNAQQFVLNANTSSLATRGVNAMVPRLVMFTNPNRAQNTVVAAFSRGEQATEIIVKDNQTDKFNFYFAVYSNPCNEGSKCLAGDLLTPEVESNFTDLSIYPREQLANTQLDCNACHLIEAAQGQTRTILRMQELQNPWTHFFRANTQGGATLIRDFQSVHGNAETYAGIPGNRVANSDPANLETFVRAQGFGNQPNEFRTGQIEGQVRNSAGGQPANNSTPGTSAQWTTQYNAALTGQFIPFPYHDVKATEPAKVTEYTTQYQQVVGTDKQNTLGDMRDSFFQARLFEISGINMNPKLQGQDLINAACTQCHRSSLDQTQSRSRFNVNLQAFSDTKGGQLTGGERDRELRTAITRISLPRTDNKKMPPERLRTLLPEQITDLTKFFCSQMQTMDAECQATMAVAQ